MCLCTLRVFEGVAFYGLTLPFFRERPEHRSVGGGCRGFEQGIVQRELVWWVIQGGLCQTPHSRYSPWVHYSRWDVSRIRPLLPQHSVERWNSWLEKGVLHCFAVKEKLQPRENKCRTYKRFWLCHIHRERLQAIQRVCLLWLEMSFLQSGKNQQTQTQRAAL